MHKIRPDLDIVLDILKATLAAFPTSKFVESLLYQYQERGSLSKKQLEGLHHKASNVASLPPGKLATLEAIILKKPTRYKSAPACRGCYGNKGPAIGGSNERDTGKVPAA